MLQDDKSQFFQEVRNVAKAFLSDHQFGPALHLSLVSIVNHSPKIVWTRDNEDLANFTVKRLLAFFFLGHLLGQDLKELEMIKDYDQYLELLLPVIEKLRMKLTGTSVDYTKFISTMKMLSCSLYVPSLKPNQHHTEITNTIMASLKGYRRLFKENSSDKIDASESLHLLYVRLQLYNTVREGSHSCLIKPTQKPINFFTGVDSL
eukprot:TRINITY_DN2230_c0_g1_i4.p1 TRINITY_DN2230_c0_g1~~TRINITY_DN2230_c0_g1_i4.p1  ORF type:complete len:205 (+),score=20.97 TRINITY_DN2230_c0_g1_i4:94-708(+)